MAKMIFDEDGLLEEPCLSCDKAYAEDIWGELCCDEKECGKEVKREHTDLDSNYICNSDSVNDVSVNDRK